MLIGTTMTLYKKDKPEPFKSIPHHSPNFGGVPFDSKIIDVVFVDIVVDCSDVFQSHDYFKLIFDCGYELELNMS